MPTITDEQRAFLRQICHTPYDDTPRLVYADWLEERAGTVECECQQLQIGDLVEHATDPKGLHCGTGIYSNAVVVSVVPFALSSVSGDMLWTSTIYPDDVRRLGKASDPGAALSRWQCDKHLDTWIVTCQRCHGTGTISNGYAERVELIRVQIELAKRPTVTDPAGHGGNKHFMYLSHMKWDCKWCELERREDSLFEQFPTNSIGIRDLLEVEWDRGFPNSITCSFADWQRNAHAILAEHPIRKVTLTTIPAIQSVGGDEWHTVKDRFEGMEEWLVTPIGKYPWPGDLTRVMCQRYWPGPPDDDGILRPAIGPNGEPEPIEYVLP